MRLCVRGISRCANAPAATSCVAWRVRGENSNARAKPQLPWSFPGPNSSRGLRAPRAGNAAERVGLLVPEDSCARCTTRLRGALREGRRKGARLTWHSYRWPAPNPRTRLLAPTLSNIVRTVLLRDRLSYACDVARSLGGKGRGVATPSYCRDWTPRARALHIRPRSSALA